MINPMANWLKSLLSRSSGPPKLAAQDQAVIIASTAPIEQEPPSQPAPTHASYAFRMHEAALDPEFHLKRDAAIELITARLDALLQPLGFARKGPLWSKELERGKASIRLLRGKSGHECLFELAFNPAPGTFAARPSTAPFGSFLQPGDEPYRDGGSVGWIEYGLLVKDPDLLDTPLRVLERRALPWLMAQGHWQSPPAADFSQRPL